MAETAGSIATGMDHRLRLIQQGVHHVFHELAGSALDAGTQTLRLLGIPAYPAERAARKFRRWDIESARDLAPIRLQAESAYFAIFVAPPDRSEGRHATDGMCSL